MRGSAVARLLRSWVRIPPEAWMSVCCECCVLCRWRSLRRADHSYRGVLPTMVRCCVWSRNLVNEEALDRVRPQRYRGENLLVLRSIWCFFLSYDLTFHFLLIEYTIYSKYKLMNLFHDLMTDHCLLLSVLRHWRANNIIWTCEKYAGWRRKN